MKLLTGWAIAAGLMAATTAAQAQRLAPYVIEMSPYTRAADIDEPYAELPPEAPIRRYAVPRYAEPR